jgi:hypothetical protein
MKTVSFLASALLIAQMPAFGNEIDRQALVKQVEQVAQGSMIPELAQESPPSVPTNVQSAPKPEPPVTVQATEPALQDELAELAKLERPQKPERTELVDPAKLKQALDALKALQNKPVSKSPSASN